MANLITEKQKKIIKNEYLFRYFSISIFIPTSLLGIFLLSYLVPYFLALDKKDIIVSELFKSVLDAENKENIGSSVVQTVKKTLDEMAAIEIYNKNVIIPSVYFNQIIESKNSSIKITKLSFDTPKPGEGQFLISGVSASREGLVLFTEALKAKNNFQLVDSPISDFAKDSDIAFTLSIKTGI